jgi:hypothetical protein
MSDLKLDAEDIHIEKAQSDEVTKPVESGDAALEVLGDGRVHHEVTPEEDRLVLRKIDRWIMPIILFVYAMQQLDKWVFAIVDRSVRGN